MTDVVVHVDQQPAAVSETKTDNSSRKRRGTNNEQNRTRNTCNLANLSILIVSIIIITGCIFGLVYTFRRYTDNGNNWYPEEYTRVSCHVRRKSTMSCTMVVNCSDTGISYEKSLGFNCLQSIDSPKQFCFDKENHEQDDDKCKKRGFEWWILVCVLILVSIGTMCTGVAAAIGDFDANTFAMSDCRKNCTCEKVVIAICALPVIIVLGIGYGIIILISTAIETCCGNC